MSPIANEALQACALCHGKSYEFNKLVLHEVANPDTTDKKSEVLRGVRDRMSPKLHVMKAA